MLWCSASCCGLRLKLFHEACIRRHNRPPISCDLRDWEVVRTGSILRCLKNMILDVREEELDSTIFPPTHSKSANEWGPVVSRGTVPALERACDLMSRYNSGIHDETLFHR